MTALVPWRGTRRAENLTSGLHVAQMTNSKLTVLYVRLIVKAASVGSWETKRRLGPLVIGR